MFFRKSKKKKEFNIFELENGSQVEIEMKIWTIKNRFEYEWEDSESIEYELDAFGETAFLYIEADDEMFMTFTKETDELIDAVAYYISSGNKVPKKIDYAGETFYLDEISEGVCFDGNTGEKEEIISYDYYNKREDRTISYEQDEDDEITAFYGNVIYEHEIHFLDNDTGAGRFA